MHGVLLSQQEEFTIRNANSLENTPLFPEMACTCALVDE